MNEARSFNKQAGCDLFSWSWLQQQVVLFLRWKKIPAGLLDSTEGRDHSAAHKKLKLPVLKFKDKFMLLSVYVLVLLAVKAVLPGDIKSRGSIDYFVSFKEMITSQLQGKLWLYDEVRGVPDVPKDQSESENESWGNSEDDDRNDDDSDDVTNNDDDDIDSDADGDNKASDSEKTDSDEDDNPNLNQNEDEEEGYEEEY
ncbi:hypothetical protein Tco_1254983, partial [Tanacetum coccineum]